jgi:hypothetical protein
MLYGCGIKSNHQAGLRGGPTHRLRAPSTRGHFKTGLESDSIWTHATERFPARACSDFVVDTLHQGVNFRRDLHVLALRAA